MFGKTVCLLMLMILPLATAQAESQGGHDRQRKSPTSLDPMNRPMDELGVTGKDDTLCSDRWYSCTTYDRQQFDQKYPGQPLNDLLRYGEPDWPDQPRGERGRHDSLDDGDRFDGD